MNLRRDNHHRRTGEIVRALFEIVMRQPGIKGSKVMDQLEARMHLNDAEIRRATWGTTGATKVGWFQKEPRGHWTVTSEGKRAFAQFAEPEEFHRELDRLYREWDQNQGESRK
jgi:restriction system protein